MSPGDWAMHCGVDRHAGTGAPRLGSTAPPAVSQEVPGANATTGETQEAHLGKAYDALKLHRYDVAVSEFRATLEIHPQLVLRARFPLAVAPFEQHKSDEARREFEIVQREVGEHPNVLYYLGRLDSENR
jgi:TolA-binding protein